ncbi:MAG: hypothetical protein HZB38_06130 [Planctomycetes bacterium]|nr:hypothetical protein [Planctomycetota bacterium]
MIPARPHRRRSPRRAPIALVGLVAAAAWWCIGCTHVITQTTAIYRDGPDQPQPAEADLAAGTRAWVWWSRASYLLVSTDTFETGWVWDHAITTVWEWDREKAEEKRRNDAHDKWLRNQGDPENEPAKPKEPQPFPAPEK